MKDGSNFERLLKLIQESYKDIDDTVIHLNHTLKDTSGDFREFDVVVESSVNNYKIKIAIECKNHNRPIQRSIVESFITKCNSIPSINKKILVSSNGFQSGAKKSAQKFGVELYTLQDLDQNLISRWLIPEHFNTLKIEFKVRNLALGTPL